MLVEKDAEYNRFHPNLFEYKIKIKKELIHDCRKAIRSINFHVLEDRTLTNMLFADDQEIAKAKI